MWVVIFVEYQRLILRIEGFPFIGADEPLVGLLVVF